MTREPPFAIPAEDKLAPCAYWVTEKIEKREMGRTNELEIVADYKFNGPSHEQKMCSFDGHAMETEEWMCTVWVHMFSSEAERKYGRNLQSGNERGERGRQRGGRRWLKFTGLQARGLDGVGRYQYRFDSPTYRHESTIRHL